MEESDLDAALRKFYAEARSKDGENYSRSALLGFRYAIERFLNGPPLNRGFKICKNPVFFLSNQMLDAKIKQLKREGNDTTTHKPALEKQDLLKLKSSQAIFPSSPHGLLRNVWFHTTLYWCRRGREGQRSLTKSSFTFETDPNNSRRFVTMTHDEASKNHPGGVVDIRSYEKLARMYETPSITDGYTALKTYLSKLNPSCDALYQYPKRNWQPNDHVWFENRPLGVNKLANMMKDISREANLSRTYTNHSVRSTAITLWAEAGLTDRQIMAISGHRNESSLRSYHSRPSSNSLQQCSDVLSSALTEKQPQTVTQSFNSSTNSSQSSHFRSEIGSIFSTCKIDKVEIHYNR
ncbi:uncharacterized protein LOC110253182 [Exaiptasia diaphana]|uniref:Tyr recombinase domain-containing protein n=1 Tax=Exaiptasia diaphana TaxID=2652724 RepID=A0A913Y700_EXADI|nr:uncharacterized protein LOC110253182 [Exaiptasia diaphana]